MPFPSRKQERKMDAAAYEFSYFPILLFLLSLKQRYPRFFTATRFPGSGNIVRLIWPVFPLARGRKFNRATPGKLDPLGVFRFFTMSRSYCIPERNLRHKKLIWISCTDFFKSSPAFMAHYFLAFTSRLPLPLPPHTWTVYLYMFKFSGPRRVATYNIFPVISPSKFWRDSLIRIRGNKRRRIVRFQRRKMQVGTVDNFIFVVFFIRPRHWCEISWSRKKQKKNTYKKIIAGKKKTFKIFQYLVQQRSISLLNIVSSLYEVVENKETFHPTFTIT